MHAHVSHALNLTSSLGRCWVAPEVVETETRFWRARAKAEDTPLDGEVIVQLRCEDSQGRGLIVRALRACAT